MASKIVEDIITEVINQVTRSNRSRAKIAKPSKGTCANTNGTVAAFGQLPRSALGTLFAVSCDYQQGDGCYRSINSAAYPCW